MSAMETMVAKVMGLNVDDMKTLIDNLRNGLDNMIANQNAILTKIENIENILSTNVADISFKDRENGG